MKKYAKIIDVKTGICEVGLGNPGDATAAEFYQSLGMKIMDVERGADGNWYVPGKVPAPGEAEILLAYENAVQKHLDTTAQGKGYDNTYTCLSYLSSTNATWYRESHAFNAWRDEVWQTCHAILDAFIAGKIPQPNIEELIAQLPVIDWGKGDIAESEV
jgi:hypothetical protein